MSDKESRVQPEDWKPLFEAQLLLTKAESVENRILRERVAELERQMRQWQTTNANCALELEQEQSARIQAEIDRDRLCVAIEAAPHGLDCRTWSTMQSDMCNCWKRDALGEGG